METIRLAVNIKIDTREHVRTKTWTGWVDEKDETEVGAVKKTQKKLKLLLI